VTPTESRSAFVAATSAGPAVDGRAPVDLSPGFTVGDRPNGGTMLALLARAGVDALPHSHPVSVSGHFLRAPQTGPAEVDVEVLRTGRSLGSARVRLEQEGRPCLEVLVTAATLPPSPTAQGAAPAPPGMPPVEECAPGKAELPGGTRVGLLEHVDLRMDPRTVGWFVGRPSGRLEMRSWARLRDGSDADPYVLLQMTDALPPAVFNVGPISWAPTVELTAHVRGLPAPGWLRVVVRGRLFADGWFDEQVEVWDSRDFLVAHAAQLALAGR
jgi:hypothetical protein